MKVEYYFNFWGNMMKKNGFFIFICLFNCLIISQFSLAMEKNSEDESINLGKRKFDDSDSPNPVSLKVAKPNDDGENSIASDHCFTISDMPPEIISHICSYLSTTELSHFREASKKDLKLVSGIDSEARVRIGKFMKGAYGEVNACSILSHVTALHQRPDYPAYERMILNSNGKFEGVTFNDALLNALTGDQSPCSRKNTFVNCIFHDMDYKIYECVYDNCKFLDACAQGCGISIFNSSFNKCTFNRFIEFNVEGFVDFKDCVLDGVECWFNFHAENSGISFKGCKINSVVFDIGTVDERTDEQILAELRIAGAVWSDEKQPKFNREKRYINGAHLKFRPQ